MFPWLVGLRFYFFAKCTSIRYQATSEPAAPRFTFLRAFTPNIFMTSSVMNDQQLDEAMKASLAGLTGKQFERTLGCSRAEFEALPRWKQRQLAGLQGKPPKKSDLKREIRRCDVESAIIEGEVQDLKASLPADVVKAAAQQPDSATARPGMRAKLFGRQHRESKAQPEEETQPPGKEELQELMRAADQCRRRADAARRALSDAADRADDHETEQVRVSAAMRRVTSEQLPRPSGSVLRTT